MASRYMRHYLTAMNSKGHGMHSPFVFRFIQHVLNNKTGQFPPAAIQRVRKELLQNKLMLHIEDMGAGSRVNASKQRTIQQLAKTAVKPRRLGELLFRMARYYKPSAVIELGTSLGITTAYLAAGHPASTIYTIEGSGQVCEKARENFSRLGLQHIRSMNGNFDDLLPQVMNEINRLDIGYVDGNHRYQPTINYFGQMLSKSHNDTILIFDDIHWSHEMEKAWKEIQSHPSVKCTVDIFFLGFVFFRSEFKEPQHFAIRF